MVSVEWKWGVQVGRVTAAEAKNSRCAAIWTVGLHVSIDVAVVCLAQLQECFRELQSICKNII